MEINEENLKILAVQLEKTQSNSANDRDPATAFLMQHETTPGFLRLLLHLVTMNEVPQRIRISGAVFFKNAVFKYWDADNCDENVITDSDRGTIKENLVQMMLNVPKTEQALLSEAVRSIAEIDFPAKWQNLLPNLMQSFENWHKPQMLVSLDTMVNMFDRYRYEEQSDELWSEIKYVVELIGQPLLGIMQKCCSEIEHTNTPDDMNLLLSVITKLCQLFYLLCYQDIPQVFVDSLDTWMDIFVNLLKFNTPLVDKPDTESPTPLENIKASICQTSSLFISKYESDVDKYVGGLVQQIWDTLTGLGEEGRYDMLVTASMQVLDKVVQKEQYKDMFANMEALSNLCEKVVIPQLKLRDTDLSMFEMDGLGYVRMDMEESNVDSRRKTSMDFVRGICTYFEEQVTMILKKHIDTLLQQYMADPINNWPHKDVAMFTMLAIAVRGSVKSMGATKLNEYVNVADFFTTHVISCLNRSQPVHDVIVADALKFITVFRSNLPVNTYHDIIDQVLPFLESDCFVVHTYAAIAIEKLLSVKENKEYRVTKDMIQPIVGKLLNSLFQALNHEESSENEYIIKAVFRVCSVAQDHMAPFADNVIKHVSGILRRVSENPKSPHFNHFLFETISCLIRYICHAQPQAVFSFEENLFGIFQEMLSKESCEEFAPYVFQLLAQLLSNNPTITDTYKGLYQSFLHPSTWEDPGNVRALVDLMKVYMLKDDGSLVGKDITPLLTIFQSLLKKKKFSSLSVSLLTTIVEGIPLNCYQDILPRAFGLVLGRLQKQSKDAAFARSVIVFFSRFMIKHSAEALISTINGVQDGIFFQVFKSVWLPRLNGIRNTKEKRIVTVAMTNLLCKCPGFLCPPYLELWPQALSSLIEMIEGKSITTGNDDDGEDAIDLAAKSGFKASFIKVSNAVLPNVDPCSQVKSASGYLAEGLAQLTQSQPNKFIGAITSMDPKVQKILEGYVQMAGVTIQ